VKAFGTKQKAFTLFDCVECVRFMVYLDPKFLIYKTKKEPHFFSEAAG
jgi:hypothetical protein